MAKTINAAPLGKRLRSLRKSNGWTLDYVAQQTGISKATLSKLENGRTNLAFTSVIKLSEGLQLPLTDLTGSETGRYAARKSMRTLEGGTRFRGADAEYEVLCDGLSGHTQVVLRATITSRGEKPNKRFHRHPGQEFILVLSGTLVLSADAGKPIQLRAGESVVFDSTIGHNYASRGKKRTDVLIVMQRTGYTDIEDTLKKGNYFSSPR